MAEAAVSKRKEFLTPPRGFVVFDLDGVVTGYTSFMKNGLADGFRPDMAAMADFSNVVGEMRSKDIVPLVLTNRPPGQMHFYSTVLGVQEGVWVTENGGSRYDVASHKDYVNPRFAEYANGVVPSIRERLMGVLGIPRVPSSVDEAQFEPGSGYVKIVVRPPEGKEAKIWADEIALREILHDYNELIDLELGKSVDINPKGLSKGFGMHDLMEINGIDPAATPVMFVADAKRDRDGAKTLVESGGRILVGAVGNSQPEFLEYVAGAGGIIAPQDTRYHSSASYLLREFMKKFNL